ncbi:MAG: radical SAM protein [Desulfuromonas sp.]|nr:MAG: radical SAM protein [Desulfuromonas sp.]
MYAGAETAITQESIHILETTQSLCSECLKVIDADITIEDGAVYMHKSCPEHGDFRHYLWPDADHYQWHKSFTFGSVLPSHPQPVDESCPRDCGLCVDHQKHPRLVELELTHRCNLRCPLCFMSAMDERDALAAELSLDEIAARLEAIREQAGPQVSIQLTGGEPTIRKDLPEIVRLCRQAGFSAIEVNTNGVRIGKDENYVRELAAAGITGVYMQFDGLDDEVYRQIRGADLLDIKLKAIEHCRAAAVQVVLSMAVVKGVNEAQMGDVLRFGLNNIDVIAGIAYQPAFRSGRFEVDSDLPLTMGDVIFQLAGQSRGVIRPYDLWPTGCSHPLCDATTYIVRQFGRGYKALGQLVDAERYLEHYRLDSPQGSVLPDLADELCPDMVGPGLSILVMNYMSAHDFDLSRLKQCSMTVAGPDGRLLPFCSYQLTANDGRRLHDFSSCSA